jgi:C4-dicarboxylate transporter DctM subunit
VATAYSLLVSFLVYREMDLATLRTVIVKAGISSAIVFFVIATSQSFSWLINVGRISQLIASTMLSLTSEPFLILSLINLLLLFLGIFLETQAIILLMAPILLPITASIGMDPLLLGIIIVVNTSIGMITPPMAVNLFVAQGIVREYGTTLERISRRIIPFFLAELVALVLLSNFPSLSLGLLQLIR